MITDTVGICTMACTPDDPQTTGNEDSCPDQARNVCGKIPLSSGTTQSFCLQRCNPRETGNDCPSQLACQPTSTFITGQLAVAACVFPACQTGADCPVYTNKICNPTTLLGCSAGEQCEVIGASGRCAVPGKCLTASGLCGAHTQGTAAAKVGGPCTADTDCGNGMFCLNETTDGGKVFRRNGYCTIAGCAFGGLSFAACPSGSTCGRLYTPGLCLRSCSLTSAVDCRGVTGDKLGDYECYAWNNFTIGTGGQLVAASPVCDTPVGCTLVQCASLGTSDGVTPNATNMTCRSPATNTTVSDTTAGAVCLDDTASGPLY